MDCSLVQVSGIAGSEGGGARLLRSWQAEELEWVAGMRYKTRGLGFG